MDTTGRLRLAAATLVPALAVLAVQMILFPLPLGVMLQGVIVGLLGALVAVGMALVYRANRILNFAQVQLGLAPTVLAVSLIVYAGVNYFLAVTVGLVGSLLVGSLVELVIIRRFFNSPRLILTVATIGLSQLLGAAALFIPLIWGQQPTSSVVHVPISLTFTVFPLVFTADDVVALIIAPLALLGVALMLRFSNIGIAVRASAERADRASLLGIPVKRLQTVVWAVAAVLSFIGVFLQAGILGLPLGLDLSFTVLLASLAALVLGNLVDLPAIALAAVALGILQQGVLWNHESDPGLVGPVLAAVVIVVLLVRRVGSSRVGFNAVSTWVVSEEVRPVPPELRSLIEVRAVRWVGGLVMGAAVLALPWLLSGNAGNQLKATAVVIFVIITISVVMLTGWAGQLTLGQMSFVAFGAATGAYATQTWHLNLALAVLIAGLTGAGVAMIVSLPTLRLRGFFPAVTTLAFAIATTSYLLNPQYFSWVPVNRVARPDLFGAIALTSQPSYYYFCLGCLVAGGVRRAPSAPLPDRPGPSGLAGERTGGAVLRDQRGSGQAHRLRPVGIRRRGGRVPLRLPSPGLHPDRLRTGPEHPGVHHRRGRWHRIPPRRRPRGHLPRRRPVVPAWSGLAGSGVGCRRPACPHDRAGWPERCGLPGARRRAAVGGHPAGAHRPEPAGRPRQG